jgi:hypothetical protein
MARGASFLPVSSTR